MMTEPEKDAEEAEFDHEEWQKLNYRDPDYVEGTHPMDTEDVTWYHHWHKPPVEREEEYPTEDA